MTQAVDQERLREWVAKEIQRHGPDLDRFVLVGHGAHARGVVAQALISDYAPAPEPEPPKKKPKKGAEEGPPPPPSPPSPLEGAGRLEIDREIASYLYPRAVGEAKTVRKSGVAGPYRFSVTSYAVDETISERWPILIELPDDGTGPEVETPSGSINGDLAKLVKASHDQIIAVTRTLTEGFEALSAAQGKEIAALRGQEIQNRELWFDYQKKVLAIDSDIEAKAKRERRTEDLFKYGKEVFDKLVGLYDLKAKLNATGTAPQGTAPALPAGPLPPPPAVDLSNVSTEQLAKSLVQMAQMLEGQNRVIDAMAAKMAELDQLAGLVKGFVGAKEG